jgi:DNA-binding transcriptional regulator YiaG
MARHCVQLQTGQYGISDYCFLGGDKKEDRMKTEPCSNCGEMAKVVCKNYEFKEMGVPVMLHKIGVIECGHCGNIDPIIPNMDGLMHVLALGLLCKPEKLCGGEVRFLRKYVNKSAVEFSRFLHMSHTHLSKIENDRYEISPQADKLVRLMIIGMDPKLNDGIKELMAIMPNITDDCCDEKKQIQIDISKGVYQYA